MGFHRLFLRYGQMYNMHGDCMKILLYFENQNMIKISGMGRAFEHQKLALTSQHIAYTTDPWDTDYDILHINTYMANSDAIIRSARENGKCVIYHAHSTEEDFKNSFLFSNQIAPYYKTWLVNRYSQADAIITPTPYSRSLLIKYGITLPIYAVSNGIVLERYAYDYEKVKAFRKYFSLADDAKTVIGVGLLFQRKGLLDFIEVAKMLPQYQFIWFGDINKLIIPREITEAMENAPENVIFPGYVKGAIIEGAYASANCFFFPSYEETEGIVVLEALAARCPMLVRDIGAYDPWLQNGKNCWMGHNNAEFADLIAKIVEHQVPDLTDAGYETAKERSIDRIGVQLKQVYTKVLEAAGKPVH